MIHLVVSDWLGITNASVPSPSAAAGLARCPNVDNTTPPTIPVKDATSSLPNISMPQSTATDALVNGSAALTVSTNAADPDWKPKLVNRKPNAK